MKSALKYFLYIFITGFAITATAQNKYNLNINSTSVGKQKVNQESSSLANQNQSFNPELTSGPCPVGEPTNPIPPDSSIDFGTYAQLSWDNPPEATELELWLGETSGYMMLEYSGTIISSHWLSGLNQLTEYQWQIIEKNDTCQTSGPIWTFTTGLDPFVLFFDNFENGIGNWEITNDGGNCVWENYFPPYPNAYSLPNTSSGGVLAADSDECGSVTTLLSTATMLNSLDLSYIPYINIEFDHDWNALDSADEAYVEMSIDDGVTWTEVESWIGVDDRENHVILESPYTGCSSTVKFRFRVIQPGWDWWWAVDNFAVHDPNWLDCPPYPPSELVAIANTPGQVLLNWQDNSFNELRFEIYRKLGDSLSTNYYDYIGFPGANITTYLDTTVLDTTLYTYRVRAYSVWGGWSAFTNQVEVLTIIPVELTSFEGSDIDGNVQLIWSTATETNNLGFNIERCQTSNVKRDKSWNDIGFVQGHGTTTEPQSYSFTDESILSGIYQYRLKQVDYDGSYEYSNVIEVEVGIPTEFSLEQNYPNPFNPTTKIRFSIPVVETHLDASPQTTLTVYDVLGNEVATLVNEEKEAGIYEVEFSATGITSGIYFYRFTAGEYKATKKMIILK
ncbi:T9SS type A sorting domain-containing protein [Bacteroidota bacterium]